MAEALAHPPVQKAATGEQDVADHRQRGHRGGLQAGGRRRGHRISDPALRHGDAGIAKLDRQRPDGLRVHHRRRRALAVRDRQARQRGAARASFCGSSGVGWMYAMEALTVTPALRIPMVAMVGNRALDDPGRLRRGAQRRAGRARPGLAADLGGQRPGGARHGADRLQSRGGPAGVAALRDLAATAPS